MTNPLPQRAGILKKSRIPLLCVAGLFAIYLLLVVAGGGLRPRYDDTFAWEDDAVLLFAHRGVWLSVPENCEAAFTEAQKCGFQGVELDVRKTKNGELAIFHDESARKMLGLDAEFKDLTLAQVKGRKLLFAGTETTNSVPTLREVFQKFGKTLRFYLDTKIKGFKDADRIVAVIEECGVRDHALLVSVNPFFIAYVEHNYPKINTALERFDARQVLLYRLTPKRWKPDYLSGDVDAVTPEHVAWLKKEHLLSKRIAYTARGTNCNRILKLGVKKVVVDYDPRVHSEVLSNSASSQR